MQTIVSRVFEKEKIMYITRSDRHPRIDMIKLLFERRNSSYSLSGQ